MTAATEFREIVKLVPAVRLVTVGAIVLGPQVAEEIPVLSVVCWTMIWLAAVTAFVLTVYVVCDDGTATTPFWA